MQSTNFVAGETSGVKRDEIATPTAAPVGITITEATPLKPEEQTPIANRKKAKADHSQLLQALRPRTSRTASPAESEISTADATTPLEDNGEKPVPKARKTYKGRREVSPAPLSPPGASSDDGRGRRGLRPRSATPLPPVPLPPVPPKTPRRGAKRKTPTEDEDDEEKPAPKAQKTPGGRRGKKAPSVPEPVAPKTPRRGAKRKTPTEDEDDEEKPAPKAQKTPGGRRGKKAPSVPEPVAPKTPRRGAKRKTPTEDEDDEEKPAPKKTTAAKGKRGGNASSVSDAASTRSSATPGPEPTKRLTRGAARRGEGHI
ncbi:hypothetical protein FN846DRAFT_138558 [Sphaerosporella brunnea]|uniref:Uncharacterized protein n=1 Tax=Sphaerosporella brunnea TaxID=1250544 RepID=A0A5J5ERZ0_9PEZI|nr:hypothetical protein FN846DRAFT_138558 [Sphaerosporella brunnea]